jgi:hypothetical protein
VVAEPEPSEPGDAAVERLVAVAVAAVAGDPLPDPLADDRVVRRVRTVVDAIRAADPARGR